MPDSNYSRAMSQDEARAWDRGFAAGQSSGAHVAMQYNDENRRLKLRLEQFTHCYEPCSQAYCRACYAHPGPCDIPNLGRGPQEGI